MAKLQVLLRPTGYHSDALHAALTVWQSGHGVVLASLLVLVGGVLLLEGLSIRRKNEAY